MCQKHASMCLAKEQQQGMVIQFRKLCAYCRDDWPGVTTGIVLKALVNASVQSIDRFLELLHIMPVFVTANLIQRVPADVNDPP